MMATTLHARGVSLVRDNNRIVNNVDVKLSGGELVGLIGPNGAGKTTTIRMISTLLEPSAGTATINGADIWKDPMGVRRQIGYMPDFFGLYDDIKVWEYLDFFAAIYKIPANQRPGIMDSVLALTDLSTKRESFVQTLSRGMQQRLCHAGLPSARGADERDDSRAAADGIHVPLLGCLPSLEPKAIPARRIVPRRPKRKMIR